MIAAATQSIRTRHLEHATTVFTAVLGVLLGAALTVVAVAGLPIFDPINRHPLLVGLHRAHQDLNAAVGYERWEPEHLDETAEHLRALAVRYDNAEPMLAEAASHIESALIHNDRQLASVAHTIVDQLEIRVRTQLRRERERLRLPAA